MTDTLSLNPADQARVLRKYCGYGPDGLRVLFPELDCGSQGGESVSDPGEILAEHTTHPPVNSASLEGHTTLVDGLKPKDAIPVAAVAAVDQLPGSRLMTPALRALAVAEMATKIALSYTTGGKE